MNFDNLKSKKVFDFFSEISKIPRGSKKEKEISDWLVKFANDRNLEVYQDDYYNVIIKKEASLGYEKYSPLIIQGHIDMVWEKNENIKFDFEKEGIKLKIENGFLKADGTTLGADNGIAVAIALAILDTNEIKHPKLEILLTTDEEVSMTGAINVDVDLLKGNKMINIDTEEFGSIYVSSAGGATIEVLTNNDYITNIEKNEKIYEFKINGLNGGHSGADIHLGLANSIKIMIEMLYNLNSKYNINIVELDGGNKDNAIPRESKAIFTSIFDVDIIKTELNSYFKHIKEKYFKVDPNINYELKELEDSKKNYTLKYDFNSGCDLLEFYNKFPNGVIKMSDEINGLVQTSLNFGVLKTEIKDGRYTFVARALLRSSKLKELDELQEKIIEESSKYNYRSEKVPSFLPWEYRENSTLRNLASNVFKEIFNKEVEIKAIHAGLECGIFVNRMKNLDVISFGPNILGAHTPEERMEINSVELTWEYIVNILEKYNLED